MRSIREACGSADESPAITGLLGATSHSLPMAAKHVAECARPAGAMVSPGSAQSGNRRCVLP